MYPCTDFFEPPICFGVRASAQRMRLLYLLPAAALWFDPGRFEAPDTSPLMATDLEIPNVMRRQIPGGMMLGATLRQHCSP